MVKKLRGDTVTYLAYVGFLVGFIGLGLFVYALAVGSAVAGVLGVALVISDIATVVLFRRGARKRAQENDSGIEIPGVNIFATPLKQDEIAQYLERYRGVRPRTRLVSVGAGAPTPREDERLAA
ncbi:hypothetical protein AU196_22640 [Mycobacterium sp. IS-1742]|uniref:hypothetical protein n=1 Tax=Mycobacterium sp. IS-1742 TaxID=1772285 RepID=UPI00074012C5|nr:hypothetical protein [Mycobacterium sp. IS-1742]KUI25829.1 hypothetical protein AU196_22640 [Mycobacterium sp. IS-1742]